MNLNDYEIRNTKKCECGYEFTIHDMNKLQRLPEAIYGGIIKHVDEIKCPKCNKNTLLLIKQVGQTYIVKDIAQKDMTLSNNETNVNNEEIICPVCKKSFKNKSGLSLHMRTHENN